MKYKHSGIYFIIKVWLVSWCSHTIIAELRRPAKRSPIPIWEAKGNPWVDFLMVIMASSIALGRVHTMTTTESRNMAAIIQIIAWQRHAAFVCCVLLWYWTSMLLSTDTCQNKVSADAYHMTILQVQVYSLSRSHLFLKLTTDQLLVFHWIVGSCLIKLLKTGQDSLEGR